MRRGVGVSAIKKKKDDAAKFQAVGRAMEETKMAGVQEVLSNFRTALFEFAQKHKTKINSDPEFRLQFHTMCVSVGVDPLASNKGFWADLLGVGDFYFELAIKVIQICLQTRSANGGIITLKELLTRIQQLNGAQAVRNSKKKAIGTSSSSGIAEVSGEDLLRAIEKLEILGKGFSIVPTNRRDDPLILSVPIEMNRDHSELMAVAQELGYVSDTMMRSLHSWTSERFTQCVGPLLQEGIVWGDLYDGVWTYWFPSLWRSDDSSLAAI